MPDTDIYLRQMDRPVGDITLGRGDDPWLRVYRFTARYFYARNALRQIREERGHAREPHYHIDIARDALDKFGRLSD